MTLKTALIATGVVLLGCISANSQTEQSFPGSYPLPNDFQFGTALNHLAKLTSAGNVTILAKSDRTGIIGLVVSGAGTTGNAAIASIGLAPCAFDGATQAGDYVVSSAAVAGDCSDSGATYPSSGQVVGRAQETHGASGTYRITLFPPEIRASSTNGPSGNATTILGLPLGASLPTDGQAWVYNAQTSTLQPVAVPYWKKVTVPYSQLVRFNATTGTITLMPRASRQKVCGVAIFAYNSFSGAGVSGINLTVGDANSTTNFYTPQAMSLIDNGENNYNVMGSGVGSSSVTATFAASGANLSALTSGSVDIDLCLTQLP